MRALPCVIVLLALPASGWAAPSAAVPRASTEPALRSAPAEAGPARQDQPERRYLRLGVARYLYLGRLTLPGQGGLPDVTLESHLLRIELAAGHFFRRTGTVLAGSLGWDHLHLSSDVGPSLSHLHHLSLRLAVGQRVHRRWMVTAFVRPGVASDLQGFDRRDVRVSAGALARFGYHPRLSFGFGLLYNNGVFGHLVLPILRVRYLGRVLRGLFEFPHRFQLWLAPARWVELGLVVRVVSGLFGVHAAGGLADRVSTLYVAGGPAVRLFAWRGLFAMVEGGYLVRYLRLLQAAEPTHSTLDFRGFYVSVSTGYLL